MGIAMPASAQILILNKSNFHYLHLRGNFLYGYCTVDK